MTYFRIRRANESESKLLSNVRLYGRRRWCGAIIFRVPQFFAHPKVPSWSSSPSRRGSPVASPSSAVGINFTREREKRGEKGGEEEKLLDERQRGQNKTTLKTIYEMRK